MFIVDPKIADLNIKDKNVLRILFSMNIHQVATPEGILEEARTYIVFFREGGGRLSAYIELLLLQTNRKLFYVCSSNPFFEADMNMVEEEARAFAEGLGAMLDEVDMTKISQDEKNRWVEEHCLLIQKPAPVPATDAKTDAPQGQQLQEAPPAQRQQAAQTPPTLHAATPPLTSQPTQAPEPQTAASPAQPVYQAPSIPKVTPAPQQSPQAPQPQPAVSPAQPVYQAPPMQPMAPTPHQPPQPQQLSAKQQQEIMQQAIKTGITKPPKHAVKKEAPTDNGVVSRDREALARLLTSF